MSKIASRLAVAVALCAGGPAIAQTTEIVIDVPPLTVSGGPAPLEIVVEVPPLVIVAEPVPLEVVIDVPPLLIVAEPVPLDVVIDVPPLVIVAEPEPLDVVIDVPALTIVAAPEEEDEIEEDLAVTQLSTGLSVRPVERPVVADELVAPEPPLVGGGDDWCYGDYTSHIGRGVGTAVGFVMPFGQNLTAPAKVEVLACAAALGVTVQGQSLTLNRVPDTRQYSGTLDLGDGPLRTLVLTCDTDLNLRGQLITADANLSIERPVWMMRGSFSALDLSDCDLPPPD